MGAKIQAPTPRFRVTVRRRARRGPNLLPPAVYLAQATNAREAIHRVRVLVHHIDGRPPKIQRVERIL